MTKFFLSIIFLFVSIFIGFTNPLTSTDTTLNIPSKASFSIVGGITGVGFDLNYLILNSPRLYLRAGTTFIGYSKLYNFEFNTRSLIKIDPDLRLGLLYTGIDYLPFKNSSLYTTVGLGYTHNVKTALTAYTETGLDISGTFISAADFGKINFEIKWNKIVPFIGIGIGRAVPKKRFGLSAELGTYYLGSPKLLMEYTGILEMTNIDEALPTIEKNMAGYAFLPYLMVKLKYGISLGNKY
jgi:hypothetical protein